MAPRRPRPTACRRAGGSECAPAGSGCPCLSSGSGVVHTLCFPHSHSPAHAEAKAGRWFGVSGVLCESPAAAVTNPPNFGGLNRQKRVLSLVRPERSPGVTSELVGLAALGLSPGLHSRPSQQASSTGLLRGHGGSCLHKAPQVGVQGPLPPWPCMSFSPQPPLVMSQPQGDPRLGSVSQRGLGAGGSGGSPVGGTTSSCSPEPLGWKGQSPGLSTKWGDVAGPARFQGRTHSPTHGDVVTRSPLHSQKCPPCHLVALPQENTVHCVPMKAGFAGPSGTSPPLSHNFTVAVPTEQGMWHHTLLNLGPNPWRKRPSHAGAHPWVRTAGACGQAHKSVTTTRVPGVLATTPAHREPQGPSKGADR